MLTGTVCVSLLEEAPLGGGDPAQKPLFSNTAITIGIYTVTPVL